MQETSQSSGERGEAPPPRRIGVDLRDEYPQKSQMLPVWFFIGVILSIYGVLILAAGVYDFSNPPPTVLAELHAPVWWGALMAVVGGVYIYLFLPRGKQ